MNGQNQRYEIKYLIPAEMKTELSHRMRAYTRADPKLPQGQCRYLVRSLYFDTTDYAAFQEKQAGLLQRSKFRVRTYPNSEPRWFLERKQRFSNRISKPKTCLSREQYEDLVAGRLPGGGDNSDVWQDFVRESARARLLPQLFIDYWRRPLVGKFDAHLRVTMDENITVSRVQGPYSQGTSYPLLERGTTILEIKFNHFCPVWVHELAQTYSLSDLAFSKYCRGLETLMRHGSVIAAAC